MAEPPVADQIADLFAREATGREPPHGTSLDIGCAIVARQIAQDIRQPAEPIRVGQ